MFNSTIVPIKFGFKWEVIDEWSGFDGVYYCTIMSSGWRPTEAWARRAAHRSMERWLASV